MKDEIRYYPAEKDLTFLPLLPEVELELFRRSKALGPGSAPREEVIMRHLAYALKLGRQFCASKLPFDDTTSAANEALVKAADSFDPEHGACFRAYLKPFVRAAIARTWRALNSVNFKNTMPTAQVSLDDPASGVSSAGGESSTLEQDDHDDYLRGLLLEVSQTLPEREQRVIFLHYVENFNFAEIGRQLDLSREAIRLIHGRVLALLKKKLAARGISSTQ